MYHALCVCTFVSASPTLVFVLVFCFLFVHMGQKQVETNILNNNIFIELKNLIQ
jgi:hypothetical protein